MVKQLPSRYFLKDGKHHIEYTFQCDRGYHFTNIGILWEEAFDCPINLSDDLSTAKLVDMCRASNRAYKYNKDDLSFIFKDLVYNNALKSTVKTPEHLKVSGY